MMHRLDCSLRACYDPVKSLSSKGGVMRLGLSVLLLSAISAFVFPADLVGQATTLGTILGNVSDPTGSSVPGASVKVTNADTGISRDVTTDSSGDFTVRSLNPGYYNVEVTAPN